MVWRYACGLDIKAWKYSAWFGLRSWDSVLFVETDKLISALHDTTDNLKIEDQDDAVQVHACDSCGFHKIPLYNLDNNKITIVP